MSKPLSKQDILKSNLGEKTNKQKNTYYGLKTDIFDQYLIHEIIAKLNII